MEPQKGSFGSDDFPFFHFGWFSGSTWRVFADFQPQPLWCTPLPGPTWNPQGTNFQPNLPFQNPHLFPLEISIPLRLPTWRRQNLPPGPVLNPEFFQPDLNVEARGRQIKGPRGFLQLGVSYSGGLKPPKHPYFWKHPVKSIKSQNHHLSWVCGCHMMSPWHTLKNFDILNTKSWRFGTWFSLSNRWFIGSSR